MSYKSDFLLAKPADKQFEEQESRGLKYNDFRFFLPISNHCERLFSGACSTSTDARKSMFPTIFDRLMFFYTIWESWVISYVNAII